MVPGTLPVPPLCITLQWSRRDGHTINLPWSLLVKGNTILLGPGQKVQGRCRPLQDSGGGTGGELQMGDTFSPNTCKV
ncbi:hypothetical protein Pmani_024567 [Petrolisthes manimaculis]|uniref:Uncharacterized protein n=1 Tax=Petrolisthes manimaculis TaxID=1843537 RepID=A0AAE1P7X6_9EUCA|nr:hypothetical protein Pmani_024567 [Petrolisthes manimaculis]